MLNDIDMGECVIKQRGFTILELVVAIFLIAIVLGTVLLLMAANLNVMDKANDIMIANALSQFTIEDVRNIEFPPVYYDRQGRFGDRPIDTATSEYKNHDGVDPVNDGNEWTPKPAELQEQFIVRRYDFRYDAAGGFLKEPTDADTDMAMKHRVDVYVLRRKDKSIVLQDFIIISRNGLF